MAAGNDDVARIAGELAQLMQLDWGSPGEFAGLLQEARFAELLGLTAGTDTEVFELLDELVRLTDAMREEEAVRPPDLNRSFADAWDDLLLLRDWHQPKRPKERRETIRKKWLTTAHKPIKSGASFRQNFEKEVFEELAKRILDTRAPAGSRHRAVTGPVQASPQSTLSAWPNGGRPPEPGQHVVILVAAAATRRGPNSGLVKLVREFEPFWRATKVRIYSLEGSYREIWRAGLLHEYEEFECLPAGFDGGLVHAAETVIATAQAEEVTCHVVYLIDPHDPSSLSPATASLKRECILTRTPFLTTYGGAARWFRLNWARSVAEGPGPDSRHLLVSQPRNGFPESTGLKEEPGTLALAAHDRHKPTMMNFSARHAELLERGFPRRYATRVTGHLLNGGSITDPEYKHDILYDVKDEDRQEVKKRIEAVTKELREEDRDGGPGHADWVVQLTRGRQGGVIQLSRMVLDKKCETVLFFLDAETPREHDMEIQVLDRAAQLADNDCLLLYDEETAARWAENVALCAEAKQEASGITLVEAYRRVFDVELVLAAPGGSPKSKPGSRQGPDDEIVPSPWEQITSAAATYTVGALHTAKRKREKEGQPVRLGFPWGGAVLDVIGGFAAREERQALRGAIGLRRFVENEDDPTKLFKARNYAIAAGEWPPLSDDSSPLFANEALRVVPTVGVIGAKVRTRESHALVDRAVRILGGQAVHYPESAFAFGSDREDLTAENSPQEDWEHLDVLVLSASPLLKRSVKAPAALATGLPTDLANFYKGCVCAVSTIYLEKADGGVKERVHDAYSQVGISMRQIKRLKIGGADIVLVNGAETKPERRLAVWGALKANLVTTFVTDEEFAWEVLRQEIKALKPHTPER